MMLYIPEVVSCAKTGLHDISNELFYAWKCADDWCVATIVSLLIGLTDSTICNSLWTLAKIKTHKMSVWAKFAKISSRKNFYLYSSMIQTLGCVANYNQMRWILGKKP